MNSEQDWSVVMDYGRGAPVSLAPWHGRLLYVLLASCIALGAAAKEPPLRLAQTNSPELTFWESVRDSKDAAEIEAYLKTYPNGKFAPLARIRLKKLQPSAPEKTEVEPPEGSEGTTTELVPGQADTQKVTVKVGEDARFKRGLLGVKISVISDELAHAFGLENTRGAFVTDVVPNGAAQLAGIQPTDVIVAFDGRQIVRMQDLPQIVGKTPPGSSVRVDIRRLAGNFNALADRLRDRAEKGDSDAAYGLGWLHATGAGASKDQAEGMRWYRKAANQGNAAAMNQLGTAYANGLGVAKDEAEAVSWFRKAAEKANAGAFYSLGWMHANGQGVSKDEAEAARWYRKAADKNHAAATYQLGAMYLNGRGVPNDDAEAVIWYRKAADLDNTDAIANLGWVYQFGRGVFQDEAQAVRWYRKAADRYHTGAMFQLGSMYESGSGVAKDLGEAVRWYRKAAYEGHLNAITALGSMYAKGRGVTKDGAEAVRQYLKAAEKGHSPAMFYLGFMYENGDGVEKDHVESVRWYRKAAVKGNSGAMHNLGVAYDNGRGVGKDPRQAAKWVFKAVKAGDDFSIKQMSENAPAYTKQFRREFQRLLREAGVYEGKIDGSFGPATKSAVEALIKQ